MDINFSTKEEDTFDIDGLGLYKCPKFLQILTKSNSSIKNLETDREERLKDSTLCNNKTFEDFISRLVKSTYKGGELLYIKEFPLPVDREKWRSICRKRFNNILGEVYWKNYVVLDYFFPVLGIAVELDSSYHEDDKDSLRDIYVKQDYGITTIRIKSYGTGNKILDNTFNNSFKGKIKDILRFKTKSKKEGGLGVDRLAPAIVNFTPYLNNKVGLEKALYEVTDEIFNNLSTNGNEVIIPKDWLDNNFPFWSEKDNPETLKKIQELFYDRFLKILTFENP